MSFARHQTFYLRAGWLAKAIDELPDRRRINGGHEVPDVRAFSGDDASVRLGIGKNMVQSLRFWVQACGIAEIKNQRIGLELSQFGGQVKDSDPFFEMDLTWWLIHYHLATGQEATSWYFLFNEFNENEFSRGRFIDAIGDKYGTETSETSYQRDYDCILATYLPSNKRGSPEDNTVCPLSRLGLIKQQRRFTRKSNPTSPIPLEALYLAIESSAQAKALGAAQDRFVNIGDLQKPKNIGPIFNLSLDAIYRYLDRLQERGLLTFTRTAGLDSVKLLHSDAWSLIKDAYELVNRGVEAHEA